MRIGPQQLLAFDHRGRGHVLGVRLACGELHRAVAGVASVAHNKAILGDVAQLFAEPQQPNRGFDDFLVGGSADTPLALPKAENLLR